MRETHSRASCGQHLLMKTWPKEGRAPSPRPAAARPRQPASVCTLTVTHTHEHRVVHTDTHKGKDSEGKPQAASQETELAGPPLPEPHTASRARQTAADAPGPPLPGGKPLAIWNSSGMPT